MAAVPLLEMLKRYQTDATKHSGGRPLLAHLGGTYRLLRDWGNPEPVCLGGLFHSIYGTQVFRHASAGLDQRARIREAVGLEAEEYAYLFCAADKRRMIPLLDQDGPRFRIHDRFCGEERDIERAVFQALLEIWLANDLEQLPHLSDRRSRAGYTGWWRKAKPFLSEPAFRHFLDFFQLSDAVPVHGA